MEPFWPARKCRKGRGEVCDFAVASVDNIGQSEIGLLSKSTPRRHCNSPTDKIYANAQASNSSYLLDRRHLEF